MNKIDCLYKLCAQILSHHIKKKLRKKFKSVDRECQAAAARALARRRFGGLEPTLRLRKTTRLCYLFIHNTTCSRLHAHTRPHDLRRPRGMACAHIDVRSLRHFTAILVMTTDLLRLWYAA